MVNYLHNLANKICMSRDRNRKTSNPHSVFKMLIASMRSEIAMVRFWVAIRAADNQV